MIRIASKLAALCLAALLSGGAWAQAPKEVVIGAIFPLSGSSAQVGVDAKAAIDTAVDLVNNAHPDIDLPFAKTEGLPNLGGAKLRIVYADHQGDPQKGRAEAERLITQDKVAALVGTYYSSVASTVSVAAERYGVPFLAADSSSPSLHKRGLKFFFRAAPHDVMFSQAMFDFYRDLKAKGIDVHDVALFHEDTLFGTDSANVQRELAAKNGIRVVADLKYRANSPSLTAEVQQLKAANPQVLMPSTYTTDAILLMKTMDELGWHPPAIVAQAAGFADKAFLDAVGERAEGIISRSSFAIDLARKRPAIAKVNALYKARSGKDLNDNTSRELEAILILADAINRAKSTDGTAIRDALKATDIPGAETIMPWRRVKFDQDGQNQDCQPVLVQFQKGEYVTIWPADFAVADVIWPMHK